MLAAKVGAELTQPATAGSISAGSIGSSRNIGFRIGNLPVDRGIANLPLAHGFDRVFAAADRTACLLLAEASLALGAFAAGEAVDQQPRGEADRHDA